jgi:hypothetical protein
VVALKFDKFGGQIPAIDERLLPEENAAFAKDAFLQAGRLEPLAADVEIHTLVDPLARFAFRIPIDNPGIENMTDSYWLEFTDPETSVVRSPVANADRFYWANADDLTPPGYNTKARIAVGDPGLILGIPRPAVAPGVTPVGGAAPTVTRAYVYTWVSSLGEEGQPSPFTVVTANVTATWNLTFTAPTGADTTGRLLATTRIYRTEVGTSGEAEFFLVDEIPIATLTYADTKTPAQVVSNSPLISTDWSGPPADLVGMVSMPNGMIAGWRNNEVWFCEPYRPHAWPTKYMQTVEAPVIGLGTVDQSLMILTAGQPYVATGIHPSVVALRQVQPLEPCTSRRSIVSTQQGVLYTSNNGLILIGPGGGTNLTYDIIRKDEWLRLANLQTLAATFFMNGYYAFSGAIEGVFQTDPPPTEDAWDTFDDFVQVDDFRGTREGMHIALGDTRLGYMTVTSDDPTYNVLLDVYTGETMVIRDGKVFHVDRREYTPRRPYLWRSKLVELPYQHAFGAAKVFFGPPLGAAPTAGTTFKMYTDGVLRYTYPLQQSGKQFRLPSGQKYQTVQFELEGQMMIFNLQVATSAKELRQV